MRESEVSGLANRECAVRYLPNVIPFRVGVRSRSQVYHSLNHHQAHHLAISESRLTSRKLCLVWHKPSRQFTPCAKHEGTNSQLSKYGYAVFGLTLTPHLLTHVFAQLSGQCADAKLSHMLSWEVRRSGRGGTQVSFFFFHGVVGSLIPEDAAMAEVGNRSNEKDLALPDWKVNEVQEHRFTRCLLELTSNHTPGGTATTKSNRSPVYRYIHIHPRTRC